jgi:hypothetical protein
MSVSYISAICPGHETSKCVMKIISAAWPIYGRLLTCPVERVYRRTEATPAWFYGPPRLAMLPKIAFDWYTINWLICMHARRWNQRFWKGVSERFFLASEARDSTENLSLCKGLMEQMVSRRTMQPLYGLRAEECWPHFIECVQRNLRYAFESWRLKYFNVCRLECLPDYFLHVSYGEMTSDCFQSYNENYSMHGG